MCHRTSWPGPHTARWGGLVSVDVSRAEDYTQARASPEHGSLLQCTAECSECLRATSLMHSLPGNKDRACTTALLEMHPGLPWSSTLPPISILAYCGARLGLHTPALSHLSLLSASSGSRFGQRCFPLPSPVALSAGFRNPGSKPSA